MKNQHCLETTLERVGRILSRKYNISVRCKANECKTDGRTIWLPALPENISESLWTLIRGEFDHETAHILFSDFNGRMKDFKQKWGDFGFDTLNVIEDVRVNYAMQKEYPGSRHNILHSIDEITQKHPIDQMPLPVRFLCSLFLAGMNLPYDQYGKDAAKMVAQFQDEAKQFKSLRNTDKACEMAERILKRLKHQEQEEKQTAKTQSSSSPQNRQDTSEQQFTNESEQDTTKLDQPSTQAESFTDVSEQQNEDKQHQESCESEEQDKPQQNTSPSEESETGSENESGEDKPLSSLPFSFFMHSQRSASYAIMNDAPPPTGTLWPVGRRSKCEHKP